ncbi:hypothetical protein LZ32DRAFT_110580 [Colletotrichum eremochloae]|nr:hypothetical protein LZ32DRAFT_110580 [Colletotrichum eremochloae]
MRACMHTHRFPVLFGSRSRCPYFVYGILVCHLSLRPTNRLAGRVRPSRSGSYLGGVAPQLTQLEVRNKTLTRKQRNKIKEGSRGDSDFPQVPGQDTTGQDRVRLVPETLTPPSSEALRGPSSPPCGFEQTLRPRSAGIPAARGGSVAAFSHVSRLGTTPDRAGPAGRGGSTRFLCSFSCNATANHPPSVRPYPSTHG